MPAATPAASPETTAAPVAPAQAAEEEDDPNAEWRSINLELSKKEDQADVSLDKNEDE